MMLKLPGVTLVIVETLCHELAREAALDVLCKVQPEEVVIYTDNFSLLKVPGAAYSRVPDWVSKLGCVQFGYYDVCRDVKTSHILFVEWDAGVWDTSMWRTGFMQYDFIGAPWLYRDESNVGNGGFSLRSKALHDFLGANREKYPIKRADGDAIICRTHRPNLEGEEDFKWAPDPVATDFAFECTKPSRESRHFGYHALRNWPLVMPHDELVRRVHLAEQSPYVVHSGMLEQLARKEQPIYLS